MYIFSTKIVVGEVTSCQSDSSCFYLASHSAFLNTFISYCFIGIFYYARACANVWSYSSSSSLQKFCIQKFFMRSKQHFIFYHKSHSRRGFGVLFWCDAVDVDDDDDVATFGPIDICTRYPRLLVLLPLWNPIRVLRLTQHWSYSYHLFWGICLD